jgi:hypothetical protein
MTSLAEISKSRNRTNLAINPQRLWDMLMETAQYRRHAEGRHQAPHRFG